MPEAASAITTANGSNVQAELDDLESRLNPSATPRATDPNLTANMETDAVSPATPTNGPNRVTFVVPSDSAVVSFGQAGPAGRIEETGITGRTKTHVHWHTTDSVDATAAILWPPKATIVTLGGPTNTANVAGFDRDEEHGKSVVQRMSGYAMVTEGNAWHDAKLQYFVASQEHDIVLRALAEDVNHGTKPTILLQSDHGNIDVVAGKTVTIAGHKNISIVSDPDTGQHDVGYTDPVTAKIQETTTTSIEKSVNSVFDYMTAVYALGTAARTLAKDIQAKKPGWQIDISHDVIKWGVGAAKLALSITRWVNEKASGKVGIVASKFASMSGGQSASMYGTYSASMTSLLSASMFATTAGVSGMLWTSVWSGLKTSVTSLKDVSLEGEWGKGKLKGYKGVELSSAKGGCSIQGETDVRINSATAGAFVHGTTGAYIGAGASLAGTGFALKVTDAELKLGAVTADVAKFSGAGGTFDPQNLVTMKKKETKITVGRSQLIMTPSNIELKAQSAHGLRINRQGNVVINSQRKIIID